MLNRRFLRACSFLVLLQFAACQGIHELPFGLCSSSDTQPVADGQWFEDCSGDSADGFTDIVRAKSEVGPNGVATTLEVRELPAVFMVNQKAVKMEHAEYLWAVRFDIGNDGRDAGDLELSISKFKSESVPTRAAILDFVQVDVSMVEGDYLDHICDARLAVHGNQLRIAANTNACKGLEQITTATRVSYFTDYNNGEPDLKYDYFPDE